MDYILLTMLIQLALFCIGSIILIKSGEQDNKTRNPYLLIPALMLISLSAGIITFLLISFASVLIFFMSEKTNKLIGKADLLLFMSVLIIIILNENTILSMILFGTLSINFILILLKKAKKDVPLIHYFAQAYALMILITIILVIAQIIWMVA